MRAKPTQSSIKQSGPLLQTGLDSPSIRSRSSTKQRQSSDSCLCTNTKQKWWLSGTLEPIQHTGGEKFGTLSLPLVELEPSLRIKLQMQSFGLAKLFQTASVCDVCKGREPHTPARERSCLAVVAKHIKCSQSSRSPGELWLQTLLQTRIQTHFFGSDRYLAQMPCLPNKLTSFPNLPLLWSKGCLLRWQKLSCFSTCVTWTWGKFNVLIIWLFHSLFLLLTIFHFPLIWRVLLSLSNLSCLSLCNEDSGSRYIMWYTVSSSHNTAGSACYKDHTWQVQDLSLGSHCILWLRNNTLQDKVNIFGLWYRDWFKKGDEA